MKKILLLLLLLVPATCTWASVTFWSDGLYFIVISEEAKTVEFTTSWNAGSPTYYKGDLVIPETVTYNGITYTVTTIGEVAESYSAGQPITSIHLPSTITTLGDYAFAGLWELKSLNIPESVKHIGKHAFAGCKTWECDELDLSMLDTVPESVLRGCINLTRVKLGAGTKHICKEAFSGCTSLTDIIGIENVETMEDKAFEDTPFYDAIYNAVTEGPVYIGHVMWAYKGNTPEVLEVMDGTTQIMHHLFQNDSTLKRVTIPGSVKDLGEQSFSWCSELASVTIGEGARTIPAYAFHSCKKLQDVTLPNTLEEIGPAAFSQCEGLETLEFPPSLQVIKYYAFKDCINLSSELQFEEGLKEIGSNAFENCARLKGELHIPQSVDNISYSAFKKCNGLTSIICNAKNISGNAFEQCWSLTSLTSSSRKIESSAFEGCRGLKTVRLMQAVKVGKQAFKDCVQIEELDTRGISNPDGLAFENCDNILTVISGVTYPGVIKDDTFSGNVTKNATLYVPEGASANYFEAIGWRRFIHIEEDDTLDGIHHVQGNSIKPGGAVFDLSGCRLNSAPARSGIYIKDGKKVVVK